MSHVHHYSRRAGTKPRQPATIYSRRS